MRNKTTWLNLLFILLLAFTASGGVNAKVASGLQNLSGELHQDQSLFNLLLHQEKTESSYDDALGSSVVVKGGLRSADSIASGPKLAKQLRLESANSPFTKSGHLTSDAIKNSREIIPASAINNPAIPKGFSKYSTGTHQSPSGNFQAHFYKNSKTGEAFYGNDYKVIFNSKSGG